ncbi:oligosaccharide biosynthesis protein Alg14-like protein [Aspergillus pseudoustus]|uniref:UDP-N-acetylglucosamine transferase subunit ALG14 n=1 Tax=Aspergillus pseudoustus TaxID=1810923 RepID=A0ABR4L0V9_9EURO
MALLYYSFTGLLAWLLFCGALGFITAILCLLSRGASKNTSVPKWRSQNSSVHLLVVLGSGGHTAEMFSMLRRIKLDPAKYTYRTYVVSSGDNFSATKASEFESTLIGCSAESQSYNIVTVPRARRVHQSYLTAPLSTLQSFYSCLLVLRGLHPDQQVRPADLLPSPYPDIILTNGPATAVCVILAARLLRLYHSCLGVLFPRRMHPHPRSMAGAAADGMTPLSGVFRLRTIFVESWARVATLSLSGKILLPFADRFLVQWPALGGKKAWWGAKKAEYVGFLVD